MSVENRTQKQIAERYKGNLGYYKKKPAAVRTYLPHFSCHPRYPGGVVSFHNYGEKTFFNPGPISSNHFGKNCAACHNSALASVAGAGPANFLQVIPGSLPTRRDF